MIDIFDETILTFSAAARRLPSLRAGRAISPATLWRWATIGCVARSGERVRLETCKLGGSSCTSLEALQRFFALLSGEETAPTAPAKPNKAQAKAESTLDAAGI